MRDVWLLFQDSLHLYISNYLLQGSRLGNGKKIDIQPIDYTIENADILVNKNWWLALVSCNNINEFYPELKEVAIQHLPIFLKKHPWAKDAECITLNQ